MACNNFKKNYIKLRFKDIIIKVSTFVIINVCHIYYFLSQNLDCHNYERKIQNFEMIHNNLKFQRHNYEFLSHTFNS